MNALRVALGFAMIVTSGATALAASAPPPGAASCSGCHSAASAAIPKLNGRDAGEIATAMTGFRDGTLPSTVMIRIAKGFTDDEVRAMAAWLAAQK